jgi:hypothetical protein
MIVWLVVSGLILLAVLLYYSREHMTNSDLISTLKTFGDKGTKKPAKDVSQSDSMPIMGPKAPPIDPADKKKNSKSGTNTSGSYPDIYGPEVPKIPGTTQTAGKHISGTTQTAGKHLSDETSDSAYEFNPDLKNAFPVEGPPQPFLTDFSKFQQ